MRLVSINAPARRYAPLALVLIGLCSGCRRDTAAVPAAAPPPRTAAAAPTSPAGPPSPPQATVPPPAPTSAGPALDETDEQRGPFTLGDQRFTVLLRSKRLRGRSDADAQTLSLLEIRDGDGAVQHRETFSTEVENGEFVETCSAGVEPLDGSNGRGLLLSTGCLPSAPLSAGPWELFGVLGGRLERIGKSIVTSGEFGAFVPGAVTRNGTITQILPDMLRVRMWTGYFFVPVAIRIDWLGRTLAPAQRCFSQTGHGFAEDGCEVTPEDAQPTRGTEQTFVRMFHESNEQSGTPAHVVVNPTSRVEIVSSKVRVIWNESADSIGLSPGEDIWVRVRVDGRDGWIHTAEDLQAVGLFQSG